MQIKVADNYQADLEVLSDPGNTKKVLHLLGEVGKWTQTTDRGDTNRSRRRMSRVISLRYRIHPCHAYAAW